MPCASASATTGRSTTSASTPTSSAWTSDSSAIARSAASVTPKARGSYSIGSPCGAAAACDRCRLDQVEAWVEQASRSFGRAHVIVDPWQTVGLAQRLTGRGLRVEEFPFTQQSVGRIAATLYGLLRDRNLALPDDEELIDELAHVRLRETAPGVFRLDHDAGRHDDRAIALALAASHLLREPERGPWQLGPNLYGDRRTACPWRPEHDGSPEHEAWARDYFDKTGDKCAACLIDWAAEADEQPPPEPERVGKFLIHDKGGTNGGTR